MWHAWGEGKSAYRILIGTHEGKIPLRKPTHRWGNNIKMDLLEIRQGVGGMHWIAPTKDRGKWIAVVNMVTNLRAP
jgi:hypothetical protein